jgi:hypothetical protein
LSGERVIGSCFQPPTRLTQFSGFAGMQPLSTKKRKGQRLQPVQIILRSNQMNKHASLLRQGREKVPRLSLKNNHFPEKIAVSLHIFPSEPLGSFKVYKSNESSM